MIGVAEPRIERPKRWSAPFGDEPLAGDDLELALSHPRFAAIDRERFPAATRLEDILRNDGRVLRPGRGAVIVRVGDYGGSMFAILRGSVRILIDVEAEKELGGRREAKSLGTVEALRQLWTNAALPEVRDLEAYGARHSLALRDEGEATRVYVPEPDRLIERYQTIPLAAGNLFGEIGPLARSPRTATVFADSDDAILLELRWQGLRDILRWAPPFREHVEALFRERSLRRQLATSPLFRHLDEETVATVAESVVFESWGEADWFASFQEVADRDSAEVIALEPVVAEEGHYVEELFLVTAGFARVSQRLDRGHRTVGYLRAGETFGLEELHRQWKNGAEPVLRHSLRAVGTLACARIPTPILEEHVFPTLPAELVPADPVGAPTERLLQSEQALFDVLVDRRIINGTATMVIDADRCVSCDQCVAACAATHDGNPRFVRHGPRHRNLQFTNACMHCVDPVCLIGCPTGAIHRRTSDGRVVIDDVTCIGCGVCADACPYHNIRMVEIRDGAGAIVLDEATSSPIVKATKCDLCAGQPAAPACENACPHDALVRIDLEDRDRLLSWTRGEHRPAQRMRAAAAVGAGLLGLVGLDGLLDGVVAQPRHPSGWVLLAAVAVLALYRVRRKLPTLKLGSSAAWARVHSALGVGSLGAFLVHTRAAWPSGGADTLLWSAFVGVTALGLGGLFVSRTFPARLRQHGEAILYERIAGFRRRLAREVEELAHRSISTSASSAIADLYATRLHSFFAAPRNLVAHVLESRAPLQELLAETRSLERYLGEEDVELLGEIRERIEQKDNLDYQLALQGMLRLWRPVHVAGTWVLLLFVLVHVALVLGLGGGGA